MSHNLTNYPPTPQNVSPSITEASPAFKAEVKRVMGSVILFFIVYILLFLLAIGLVIASVYGGIAIIAGVRHFLGIVAGIGLIGLGIMVLIFLIKFLFAVSKYDPSGSIEITEEEQPRLFAFIQQVAKDTGAPLPKRVFLSSEVNASVFYNSSFWSMFLPVRKNLQIGLGLVNAINVSEFKAILAHEFGHFSQRSMKLGSFVYHVNKIIYNMLFDNDSYSKALSGWASVSDIFAIFASATAKIAQGIQWVLRQMYGVINKNYMRLSREMEFHADAVAASVSGSSSLASALRRVELADTGYNMALRKCDDLFREKKIVANIYEKQSLMLQQLAKEFKLQYENELPVVTSEFLETNKTSRINYKDQWASHPSTEDRAEHLNKLAVKADLVTTSAWVLFNDKERLETDLTRKIYEQVPIEGDMQIVAKEEFATILQQENERYNLPEVFGNFYNGRQIAIPEETVGENAGAESYQRLEDVMTPEILALPKKVVTIANDLEIIKAITNKQIGVKTFDFDGVKYDSTEAQEIAGKLEVELKQAEEQLKKGDKAIIDFFIALDKKKGSSAIAAGYEAYFARRKKANTFLTNINKMLESLSPIYSGQTIPIEDINRMITDLKNVYEPVYKKELKEWLEEGVFDEKEAEKKKIEQYLQSSYVYFSGDSFFDNELTELNETCNSSWNTIQEKLFFQFKNLLVRQGSLLSAD